MTDIPYSAIVCDIDGTLVHKDKRLSAYTREAIRRVVGAGAHLVLASARMPRSIQMVRAELGVPASIVSYDGGLVYGSEAGLELASFEMDTKSVRSAIELAVRSGAHVGIFARDEWIVEDIDYWALREIRGTGTWPLEESLCGSLDRWNEDGRGVHKVMIRTDSQGMDRLEPMLADSISDARVRVRRSGATQLELGSSDATKSAGVRRVLEEVGRTLETAVAFGDGVNDHDLIQDAGLGIAVENAHPMVRRAADELTLSNDEDGVGFMLMKLFRKCADPR